MGDETRKAVGLFWDIENCQVPRNVSALSVVQRLREKFFAGLREAEFMCVCDIHKENKNIIEELNSGQVNIVHISATAKNAADDKIRQSLRRFADTHPSETHVVLVSGDVNFSPELSDLRHRKHMYIIVVHGKQVSESLLAFADEHYVFDTVMADLPERPMPKISMQTVRHLAVHGFPSTANKEQVRKRLNFLANNTGGRVVHIKDHVAQLAFPSYETLIRAKKRMEGEDVCGQRISVSNSHWDSPSKSAGRQRSHSEGPGHRTQSPNAAPGAPRGSSPSKSYHTQNYCSQNISNNYASSGYCQTAKPSSSFTNLPEDQGEKGLDNQAQNTVFPTPVLSEPPPGFSTCRPDLMFPGPYNVPPVHNPKPVYPYNGPRIPMAAYNLGPRQAASRFSLDYNAACSNRPRSRGPQPSSFNASAQSQVTPPPNAQQQQAQPSSRPGSAKALSSPDVFNDEDDDDSVYYKSQLGSAEGDTAGSVELTVTNLDYNISKKEWRKILAATFQPHVQVLGICVRTQADNTSIATIKVPGMEEARYAISQFHRRKIGYKRINVILNDDKDQVPAESTRQETIAVLSDSKTYTMPVFKFIENYEKRYHKSVSVSDLYKMKDVVEILDRGGAGRMVKLARGVCPTPSPTPEDLSDPYQQEDTMPPVCPIHCPDGTPQYAEAMSIGMLPNVRLQRKPFTAHVHSLLLNHSGVMPLMSFPICYAAEFGIIPQCAEDGIPMEHLISCLPGIEIVVTKKGTKIIHFQENKDPPGAEALCGRSSPVLTQQMALLSREIGDLLRQSRTCSIPASKFIPAYHHHFGRQCRVADYGYNKLHELFDALPHVLQVLGTGDRKVLTLCHRAQVKRFIADVLKVLKTQPGRQLAVADLSQAYERMLFRKFDITHYGVSYIEDMFADIPATSIMITREGNKDIMAIPKRDQTPEEMKRTEQFALELVDLLKHNPQCRMTFNKFIPAYHHHFGRQCRVADYGFTRLTDLFESISHVVDIVDDEEERMIKLTAPEMRLVLAEQIVGLLKESPGMSISLDQLLLAFQRQYGFPLRLSDYGACDVRHIMEKIKHCTFVDKRENPPVVRLRLQEEIPLLAVRIVRLLMDQSGGCLPLVEVCSRYHSIYGTDLDVQTVQEELVNYVQVTSDGDDGSALIRLTALQVLGRDIRLLLKKVRCVALHLFGQAYQDMFFIELKPALYGFPDIPSLLRALLHIIKLTGKMGRRFVELSPGFGSEDEEVAEIERVSSISRYEDYLSAPVPSAVPSPELQPSQNLNSIPDLMKFDSLENGDKLWEINDDEKKSLLSPLCRTPTSELMQLAGSGSSNSSLPSPNPPCPSPHTFPGNVPLSSPFPPPPPFPTDIAPPPLNEGVPFRPIFPPPVQQPLPLLPKCQTPPLPLPSFSTAPLVSRSPAAFPVPSAAAFSTCLDTVKLEDLLPTTHQKRKEDDSLWKLTAMQRQNDTNVGQFGPCAAVSISGTAVTGSPQSISNGRVLASLPWTRRSEAESGLQALLATMKQGSSSAGSREGPATAMQRNAVDALCCADPSIIQSSLSAGPLPGLMQFGQGTFLEVKVADPGSRGQKDVAFSDSSSLSENGTDSKASTPLLETTLVKLTDELEESLSLSVDGEDGNITVLEVCRPGAQPEDGSTHSLNLTVPEALSSASQKNEDHLAGKRVSLLQTSLQPAMSPAGDAPASLLASKLQSNTLSMPSCSIPADDSFCQDQPLDTSSTRSLDSGSKGSCGSFSDSASLSPSPRKVPRRARLAAKFPMPNNCH